MSDKELTQHINDINKGRAKYYEFYSGQEWGGRLNYDLCVNTTQLDLGEVVAAIAKLF